MSKKLMVFVVVVALSLGVTGCKEKTASEKASDAANSAGTAVKEAVKDAGQAVGHAAETSGKAVGDAAKATGEYLTGSKEATVKAAQETLNGIEKKWQELQAKAAPTTDDPDSFCWRE